MADVVTGGDREGTYSKSNMSAMSVAREIASGYRGVSYREIYCPKTRDKGVEVTLELPGGKEGNFKIYKVTSEANMDKQVGALRNIEKTMTARMKKPYIWGFLTRKDLLLDTKMIPEGNRKDIDKRFLRIAE